MSVVVGVHGIAQQQRGRHQLLAPWSQALADGVERATGSRVAVPDLDIAFYADLFLPPPASVGTKAGVVAEAGATDLGDVDDADVAMVVAAAGEVLSESDLAGADDAAAKGFPGLPAGLLRVVAAMDRRFGRHAGSLFAGELRQVRRYLSDPQLKAAVDARVADAVGGGCLVLIGHSLGSVVALEHLRLHPGGPVELLVTLGSPLGLRAIRHLLPDPGYGTGAGGLGSVRRWVNLRDRRDPVALAGDLSVVWPMAQDDDTIDNGSAPHAAERYLSKRQTGAAVHPVLAPPR